MALFYLSLGCRVKLIGLRELSKTSECLGALKFQRHSLCPPKILPAFKSLKIIPRQNKSTPRP